MCLRAQRRVRTSIWAVEVMDPWLESILHIPSTSFQHSSLQSSHADSLMNKQAGDGRVISEHELSHEAVGEGGGGRELFVFYQIKLGMLSGHPSGVLSG